MIKKLTIIIIASVHVFNLGQKGQTLGKNNGQMDRQTVALPLLLDMASIITSSVTIGSERLRNVFVE